MLLGRVPAERHVHLDAAGQPCRAADAVETVLEREPEWTERDRHKMLALALYESQICPDCGFHESLHDPATNFYRGEFRVCPIAKGAAGIEARQNKLDEQWAKRQPEHVTTHPRHGRRLVMVRLSPEQVEDERAKRKEATGGHTA